MVAYVKDGDVSDALMIVMDLLDSEGDLARRATLLGLTRKTANHLLDVRLMRLMLDLHDAGWTQREIAEAVSLAPRTVSVWFARYREMKGLPSTSRLEREVDLANAIELRSGFKG